MAITMQPRPSESIPPIKEENYLQDFLEGVYDDLDIKDQKNIGSKVCYVDGLSRYIHETAEAGMTQIENGEYIDEKTFNKKVRDIPINNN